MAAMAMVVGGVCGIVVTVVARGRKTLPFLSISAFASILGIAIGKYMVLHHYLWMFLTDKYGPAAADQLPVISWTVVRFLVQRAPQVIDSYDIGWIGLAVMTAWGIPYYASRTERGRALYLALQQQ